MRHVMRSAAVSRPAGWSGLSLALGLTALAACSDPAEPAQEGIPAGGTESSLGGSTSTSSGGAAGAVATGGSTSSGGAPASSGGSTGAGAGGAPSAGGATPSGGTPSASGGQSVVGGASGTTGGSGAGGSGAGGAAGTASGGASGVAGTSSQGGGGGSGTGGSSGAGGGGASGAGTGGASATGGSGGAPFGVCTGTPPSAVTVYMIGDSTMSIYDADLYPRMGWGQPLGDLFAPQCATVVDKALSGRSSKSFYDEGAWTPVKSALKAGDYVLIQFAHNDEKDDDAARYTEPQTTFKQYLTIYIDDARAAGATPMLLTPINRNKWSGATLQDSHGAYPPAMRELAQSLSVELVDLTALSKEYFERIGQTETTKLFMELSAGQFPNYPDGNSDSTHLQETGARLIGRMAMADAYQQKLTLATYLAAVPTAP